MEKLCHQGELLLKKVSDQTDRDMIQEPLTELRHLWDNLGDKINHRQVPSFSIIWNQMVHNYFVHAANIIVHVFKLNYSCLSDTTAQVGGSPVGPGSVPACPVWTAGLAKPHTYHSRHTATSQLWSQGHWNRTCQTPRMFSVITSNLWLKFNLLIFSFDQFFTFFYFYLFHILLSNSSIHIWDTLSGVA